ncbi:unnamed protein product [Fraxinus pennsylvanica]|uniref:Uncharacterized protein n=1 Tax=Fraxinus pennsylvanica TaxID=56036 RepID=A0AAD2DVT0_9LAMI|nr:unnamed protein product [Fraxinus pennsylvanica]
MRSVIHVNFKDDDWHCLFVMRFRMKKVLMDQRKTVDQCICICSVYALNLDEKLLYFSTLIKLCVRCLSNEPSERPSVEDEIWNLQLQLKSRLHRTKIPTEIQSPIQGI